MARKHQRTKKEQIAYRQSDAFKEECRTRWQNQSPYTKMLHARATLAGIRRATSKVLTCPHCGKEGRLPGIKVHHFDNCKQRNPVPGPRTVETGSANPGPRTIETGSTNAELKQCPHCQVLGSGTAFIRAHYGNCPRRKDDY